MTIHPICQGSTDVLRHTWRRTASVGWYRCAVCKMAAVCIICLQQLGKPIPQHPLKLACAHHNLNALNS